MTTKFKPSTIVVGSNHYVLRRTRRRFGCYECCLYANPGKFDSCRGQPDNPYRLALATLPNGGCQHGYCRYLQLLDQGDVSI